jgi:hypothetical protein
MRLHSSRCQRGKWEMTMYKGVKLGVATAMVGMAVLSGAGPAHAGHGSAIGAGLVGFGFGTVLGSMLTPSEVYYAPPPPDYYGYDGYGYYGYDDYGPVDYGPDYDDGPDYGPPPPPRPHPRVTAPAHRDANQSRAVPASSSKPTKATSSSTAAQKAETKFKAVQAKAKREGVENLTQQDIQGLSSAQLKQLRGY